MTSKCGAQRGEGGGESYQGKTCWSRSEPEAGGSDAEKHRNGKRGTPPRRLSALQAAENREASASVIPNFDLRGGGICFSTGMPKKSRFLAPKAGASEGQCCGGSIFFRTLLDPDLLLSASVLVAVTFVTCLNGCAHPWMNAALEIGDLSFFHLCSR
jgi:hypothetical protein